LKLGDSWTNYPLHFHELTASDPEVIFDDGTLSVKTLPLDHRVYTNGFLFELSPGERKLRIGEVRKYSIDKAYYQKIKQGADGTDPDGNQIPNALLTDPLPEPKRYAYCSDTAYFPELASLIQGVDTLYHESTFLESESDLAPKTKHSTAAQAARIALKANAGRLILGHYSTRYKNLERFREEATEIFPQTELAEDGKFFEW
jgi:ribonuclease Z